MTAPSPPRCARTDTHGPHHTEIRKPPHGYTGAWKGRDFCSFAYPTATTSECHRLTHFCIGIPPAEQEGT